MRSESIDLLLLLGFRNESSFYIFGCAKVMEDMLLLDENMNCSPACVDKTMAFLPYGYSILGYVASQTNERLFEAISSHASGPVLVGTYNRFRFHISFLFNPRGCVDVACSDGSPIECHNPSAIPSKLEKFTWIRVSYPLQLSVPTSASEEERQQLILDALDKEQMVLGGGCVIDASTATPLSELQEVKTAPATLYYLNKQRWMRPLLCLEACDVVSQFQPAGAVSKSDQRDCALLPYA